MSRPSPRRRILARLLAAAALFASGVAAGWLLHTAASNRRAPATGERVTQMIHSQSERPWHFISPLLECETAESFLHQPAITAAKLRAGAFIESHLKKEGVVHASVYFRQLHDGPWFGINERDRYVPASLLKIPTLLTVLKIAERDPGLLQRKLTFDAPDDLNRLMLNPPAATLHRGNAYTIEELCRRMAAESDNNAARLLNEFVTEGQINRTLFALGLLSELELPGEMLDIKSLSAFFRVLYNATFLSPEMSELALEMLSHSSFREGLLSGVPAGLRVSGKYGEAWVSEDLHQLHEFGIFYHPDHPYLLGVMTQGRDYPAMKEFIRGLSRIVYEGVDAQPLLREPLQIGPAAD